jgi:hypothetical protein
MEKYYLLVKWIEERNMYSVVGNNKIIDKSLQQANKELVGQVIDIAWKDESGAAKVLETTI